MFQSYLSKTYNKSELQRIEEQIALEMGNHQDALTVEAANNLAKFDGKWDNLGADQASEITAAAKAAREVLEDAGFEKFLTQLIVGNDEKAIQDFEPKEHAGFQAGMTSAMTMIIAAASPQAYAEAYTSPGGTVDSNTRVVGELEGYDVEGFDDFKFDKFTVKSAMTAGIVAATSPYSQTFFRPAVLPASQNGLDMRVTIPETYRRTYRPGTGAENKFARKSLVRAASDASILEDNSTDIIPVDDTARQGAGSVVTAVPTKNVEQHGVQVPTRPLPYGKKIDLVDVSSNAELIKFGVMTEQDTLDPLVSIGRQVVSITAGGNESWVEVDLTTAAGAMLNYQAEGDVKTTATTGEFSVWVKSTDDDYQGNPIGTALDLSGEAWLTGDWRAEISVRLSGSVDQDANMIVDVAEVKFLQVQFGTDFSTIATDAQVAAFNTAAAVDLERSGYFPEARRSNSNMKDVGTIVDEGRTYNYRLAAPLGAPLSSVKPLAALGNGVSIDSLSSTARLRDLGTAVTTLFDFEKRMIATQDLPGQAPGIGGKLIKPKYRSSSVSVLSTVLTRDSRHMSEDLRVHLVNAITMEANFLIQQTEYLPALQLYTGSRANFEVIVVTDPVIASHLMTSGDGRTIGNNRRFKISEVDDERMRGRIYVSLARTDTTGADVLSFGAQIMVAPFVHQAQVTLNGSTHNMQQIIPRTSFHPILPALSRIDVAGMEDFYRD